MIAGLQVPVIAGLFVEVVGNAGMDAPAQYGPTAVNVGVTFGLITMSSVVVTAHCPADGVNVYIVVVVLLIAGLHVPVIPGLFVEVVGNAGMDAPAQYGPTALNVGNTFGLIVIVNVVVVAH